jgi:hypothetical protein
MQRSELEAIVRSAPCGFERRVDGSDFVRQGMESLPTPAIFRIDNIEYRAYADRDTNEVWMIALRGGHLDRKQGAMVPLHMRSLIDALVEQLGAPIDRMPDEVIDRIPVPSPYEHVRSIDSYATWKRGESLIRAYVRQTYEGWDLEVRIDEVQRPGKG